MRFLFLWAQRIKIYFILNIKTYYKADSKALAVFFSFLTKPLNYLWSIFLSNQIENIETAVLGLTNILHENPFLTATNKKRFQFKGK